MMDATGAYRRINLARRAVEEECPPANTGAYHEAWKHALARLIEAEAWMMRAQIIEHDRLNAAEPDVALVEA